MPFILITFLSACGNHDPQTTLKPFEGTSARVPPKGTVRRDIESYALGTNGFPKEFIVNEKFVEEGKILYERTCSACHGYSGRGNGIAAERGLSQIPSFHNPNLLNITPEKLFHVMTEGQGGMPSYARRLTFLERWKTASYVKALQLSFAIPMKELTENDKKEIP